MTKLLLEAALRMYNRDVHRHVVTNVSITEP